MSRLLLTFACLVPLLTVGSAAPPPITLTVTPAHGFAPMTVRARATIQPHPANRVLCFIWDASDGEAGSRCYGHEGTDAPYTREERIILRAGTYGMIVYVARVGEPSPQSSVVPITVIDTIPQ